MLLRVGLQWLRPRCHQVRQWEAAVDELMAVVKPFGR